MHLLRLSLMRQATTTLKVRSCEKRQATGILSPSLLTVHQTILLQLLRTSLHTHREAQLNMLHRAVHRLNRLH